MKKLILLSAFFQYECNQDHIFEKAGDSAEICYISDSSEDPILEQLMYKKINEDLGKHIREALISETRAVTHTIINVFEEILYLLQKQVFEFESLKSLFSIIANDEELTFIRPYDKKYYNKRGILDLSRNYDCLINKTKELFESKSYKYSKKLFTPNFELLSRKDSYIEIEDDALSIPNLLVKQYYHTFMDIFHKINFLENLIKKRPMKLYSNGKCKNTLPYGDVINSLLFKKNIAFFKSIEQILNDETKEHIIYVILKNTTKHLISIELSCMLLSFILDTFMVGDLFLVKNISKYKYKCDDERIQNIFGHYSYEKVLTHAYNNLFAHSLSEVFSHSSCLQKCTYDMIKNLKLIDETFGENVALSKDPLLEELIRNKNMEN